MYKLDNDLEYLVDDKGTRIAPIAKVFGECSVKEEYQYHTLIQDSMECQ